MASRGRKDEKLEARVPPDVKQRIEYAASLQGLSVAEFIAAAADERARAVIEQNLVVRLTVEDSMCLAKAILNPPAPNAKAIAAARRSRGKTDSTRKQ